MAPVGRAAPVLSLEPEAEGTRAVGECGRQPGVGRADLPPGASGFRPRPCCSPAGGPLARFSLLRVSASPSV